MTLQVSTFLLIFAAFQVGCGGKVDQFHIADDPMGSDTSATSRSQGSSLNSFYHSDKGWTSKVVFMIDEKASHDVLNASLRAADTWNQAIGYELLRYGGRQKGNHGSSLYESLGDDITVIYMENDWIETTKKQVSTLATTVWENNSGDARVIAKGDIIMNLENYLFVDSETVFESEDPSKSIADTETVILHEFGHLLGLNHVSDEQDQDSVMLAYTLIGAQIYQRSLSQGDLDRIQALYTNR